MHDSLARKEILKNLRVLGYPIELIMVRMTLQNSRGLVLVKGEVFRGFVIYIGVKEKDPLSLLLFNMMRIDYESS